MVVLQLIFWLSIVGIIHTYALYPLILKILSGNRALSGDKFLENDLPHVSIVIAAYNEEKVIRDKLNSIIACNYDKSKLEVLVGSDGSSDNTDKIVSEFSNKYPFIKLHKRERGGKTRMLNYLTPITKHDIIVYTDANVIFSQDLLINLLSRFKDTSIGLIGANIKTVEHLNQGISYQEEKYIERENYIKFREGLLWGSMIGAFGGCFALRKKLFCKIPEHFIVDDFYVNMKILQAKYSSILELEAVCYEEVSIKESEEFRRKVRMSSGNFQNLFLFLPMLWKNKLPVGFCFFSHKILRWITPILLVITLVTAYILQDTHAIYKLALYVQIALLLSPILNRILRSIGIKIRLLHFISYFYSMNLALLKGMFKFFSGIKSSVWEPTERHV